MNFSHLIDLFLKAGGTLTKFPFLGKLIAKWSGEIVSSAESVPDFAIDPTTTIDILKTAIVNWLTAQRDATNVPALKVLYSLLIVLAPVLVGLVWDQLKQSQHVVSASEHSVDHVAEVSDVHAKFDEMAAVKDCFAKMEHQDFANVFGLPA